MCNATAPLGRHPSASVGKCASFFFGALRPCGAPLVRGLRGPATPRDQRAAAGCCPEARSRVSCSFSSSRIEHVLELELRARKRVTCTSSAVLLYAASSKSDKYRLRKFRVLF